VPFNVYKKACAKNSHNEQVDLEKFRMLVGRAFTKITRKPVKVK